MASDCHAASSYGKHKKQLDLVTHKIIEYGVEPRNTYNVDEKDIMTRIIGKRSQVFSKPSYQRKHASRSFHNGKREWTTVWCVLVVVVVQHSHQVLYFKPTLRINNPCVFRVNKKKHSVFATVPRSGWSNDNIGWPGYQ